MTPQSPTHHGKILFVAESGHNDNTGSSQAPWRTIQYAINQAKAGDTVLVKSGIYKESVQITKSGAKDRWITLASAPGHNAIIDGSELKSQTSPHAFHIDPHQKFIKIQDFEIRNFYTKKDWELAAGIYVAGGSKHIKIINNHIHHIASHAKHPIANGIGIYGLDKEPSEHITVINNHLHNLTLGWSEALVINGNVAQFSIQDNHIHHTNNIGIDVIGHEEWVEQEGVPKSLNYARQGKIDGNYIHHIDTLSNPVYDGDRSAGGIYVDGGKHINITRNIVHDANIGIEVASENPGNASHDVEVSNNILFNNHIGGIALGGYDSERGQATHNRIQHNIFYHNDTSHSGNGELWLQHAVKNTDIQYNIFHANSQGILVNSVISKTLSSTHHNTVDNNEYFVQTEGSNINQGRWVSGTKTLSSLKQFQESTGKDLKSVFKETALHHPKTGNYQYLITDSKKPGLTQDPENNFFLSKNKKKALTQTEFTEKPLSTKNTTPSTFLSSFDYHDTAIIVTPLIVIITLLTIAKKNKKLA